MSQRIVVKLIGLAVFGSSLLLTVGTASAAGLLQKARADGITVGIANEIPYGFQGINGQVEGIAPTIVKKVLSGMGISKIDWEILPFGQLIPAAKARRIDLAAASQNVLPARCKEVAFSRVNSSYGEGLLVARGNPRNIHSYADIKNNSALKLGIVTGADQLSFAQAVGIPQSQIVLIRSNSDAVPALLSHRIDAYAATGLTVSQLEKRSPVVVRAEPFTQPTYHGKPTRSYGAFSMRKADKAFLKAFNRQLAEVQKTPFWANTLKHYGLSAEDIAAARKASTAKLCGGE